jgi:phospholipid/cholesterol/gamma-HCH transport system permease protein
MIRLISGLGRIVIEFGEDIGQVGILLFKSIASLRRPPFYFHAWFVQMLEVGNRSLPVVLVTSLFSGMVFALQSWQGFARFGATEMTGTVVAIAITREMVPVLASLMVAGRAGSAMAAEIGTMVVTEQVDALRTMGTDPIEYLAVPRLIATSIMLPVVVMIGDLVGIYGGYLVVVKLMGGGEVTYWQRTWEFLMMSDVTSGLIKAAVFGLIIAMFGCVRGFNTSGGAQGVGRATTGAVVGGSMGILISNFFLTKLLIG